MTGKGEGSSTRQRLDKSRYRDEPEQKKRKTEEEGEEDSKTESSENEEKNVTADAKPVGEAVKITRKGKAKITHYKAFVFDNEKYNLEDTVILAPSDGREPYVARIKDIYRDTDGSLQVLGQWFYRPEDAKKKGGGFWHSRDIRELFYSFHYDTFEAECVMHKCIVHFLPLHKRIPERKVHPGFIVQKVYDTVNKRLWNLTDSDYEDDKQQEIELLVQKTLSLLGDLPDVKTRKPVTEQEERVKDKRLSGKKNISALNVSRSGRTARADEYLKETQGSSSSHASEYHAILENYAALTSDNHRDKWMEKLLEAVKQACEHCVVKDDNRNDADKVNKNNSEGEDMNIAKCKLTCIAVYLTCYTLQIPYVPLQWPDFAVRAVYALEKVTHALYNFQKYNQKMRSLVFNFQKNPILAFRLLDDKLKPSDILNMSPNELKEAFTIEETGTEEPDDEPECMQMTDECCSRCNEFKVGIRDIIQAGGRYRYQLECMECGYSWYASRDEFSIMTVEPNSARTVGTAPLATSNFEDVEKNRASPPESDRAAG